MAKWSRLELGNGTLKSVMSQIAHCCATGCKHDYETAGGSMSGKTIVLTTERNYDEVIGAC